MIRIIRPMLLPFQGKALSTNAQELARWNSLTDDAIKQQLVNAFRGKCGYCERRGSSIDHYRPKREDGIDDKSGADEDYGRTWDWDNFVWCCDRCQQVKSNLPITSGHARLLDPCCDEPLDHLLFLPATGQIVGTTEPGKFTVGERLQLNEPTLVEGRRRKFYRVRRFMDLLFMSGIPAEARLKVQDELACEFRSDQEFLGQFRQIFLLEQDPYHRIFSQLLAIQQVKHAVDEWCQPHHSTPKPML